MKPKPGLPQNVLLSEGLGPTVRVPTALGALGEPEAWYLPATLIRRAGSYLNKSPATRTAVPVLVALSLVIHLKLLVDVELAADNWAALSRGSLFDIRLVLALVALPPSKLTAKDFPHHLVGLKCCLPAVRTLTLSLLSWFFWRPKKALAGLV